MGGLRRLVWLLRWLANIRLARRYTKDDHDFETGQFYAIPGSGE